MLTKRQISQLVTSIGNDEVLINAEYLNEEAPCEKLFQRQDKRIKKLLKGIGKPDGFKIDEVGTPSQWFVDAGHPATFAYVLGDGSWC